MKQKEIFVDPSLSFETQKMVEMYFAIKTVSSIEGFVYSEEEFLKKYKNTYTLDYLQTSKYYAVYKANCMSCFKTHEIIISNRTQLYQLSNSNKLICNRCNIFEATIKRNLDIQF